MCEADSLLTPAAGAIYGIAERISKRSWMCVAGSRRAYRCRQELQLKLKSRVRARARATRFGPRRASSSTAPCIPPPAVCWPATPLETLLARTTRRTSPDSAQAPPEAAQISPHGDPAPATSGIPGSLPPPSPIAPPGLRRTFSAFRHRNFRIFWAGALVSNIGTWMQSVAQGWLVLELTDSALLLGVTGFAGSVPMLMLLLVGGVFADRMDRRRLLIGLQVALMALALALATLTAFEVVTIWQVLLLSFLTGICFAFSAPTYQSLLSAIVERRDLVNAIALNSMQFNLSRVVGPAIGGAVVAVGGLALCFYANATSFLASIVALASLRVERTVRAQQPPLWDSFLEGVAYVRGRPRVKAILLSVASISVFAMPYATMLPIFARDLGLGPGGLGYLMAAAGCGAVVGALTLAARSPMPRRGANVLGGVALTAVGVIGFALAGTFALMAAFLFVLGFAATSTVALCNSLVQELVTDAMRGRVMSMFGLAFMGTLPVGNLLAGAGAKLVGAPAGFAIAGALLLAMAGLLTWRSPRLRAFE